MLAVRVSAASTLRCDVSVLQFAVDAATQHSTTTTAGNKGHLSKRETAVSRAEELRSPALPIMTRIKSVCRPLSARFVWPFKLVRLVRLAEGSRAVPA